MVPNFWLTRGAERRWLAWEYPLLGFLMGLCSSWGDFQQNPNYGLFRWDPWVYLETFHPWECTLTPPTTVTGGKKGVSTQMPHPHQIPLVFLPFTHWQMFKKILLWFCISFLIIDMSRSTKCTWKLGKLNPVWVTRLREDKGKTFHFASSWSLKTKKEIKRRYTVH